MLLGVCVLVGVRVRVGVLVGVLVIVGVEVGVLVTITVGVGVGVRVRVAVKVHVGLRVGVLVEVLVGVLVGVRLGVLVGVVVTVTLTEATTVGVTVISGVSVTGMVGVSSAVAVGNGVGLPRPQTPSVPILPESQGPKVVEQTGMAPIRNGHSAAHIRCESFQLAQHSGTRVGEGSGVSGKAVAFRTANAIRTKLNTSAEHVVPSPEIRLITISSPSARNLSIITLCPSVSDVSPDYSSTHIVTQPSPS